MGVDDLDVHEDEVGAVGVQAAGGEADGGGGSGGMELFRGDLVACGVLGDGFEGAGANAAWGR